MASLHPMARTAQPVAARTPQQVCARSFSAAAATQGKDFNGSWAKTKSDYIGYGFTIPPPASSKPGKDDVKIELSKPFKGHKLDPPPAHAYTNPTELLQLYKVMAYYRRFEIVADTMYKQRLIRGFCHLYDGQEAIVTGMESALKRTDSVITAYRDHCHQLSRGDSGESVMSELMGKEAGCSRGKGGSMHMYLEAGKFYGGNGIVGAQIPLGAGLAFAHKFRKDGGVAVAAMGDGASNQGQVYEAANMAALWKLPIIFLVENNEYGMGTATKRASASTQFYTRGDYIPGLWIDGMDVLACKAGFQFAREWCASGKGPIFVEAQTYRYHGHSMSDPGVSYRSREEVASVREGRDCIDKVRALLLKKGWVDEAQLKQIDKDIRVACDKTVDFAKKSQELGPHEMFTDVYRGTPPPFIRTVDHRNSIRGDQIKQ